MTKLLTPLFLQEGKAKELNKKIYTNTSCFLFMCQPDLDNYLPSPISNQENAVSVVLNLYKIYRDYGCFFVWVCLQDNMLPMKADPEYGDTYKEALKNLRHSRAKVFKHYNSIVTAI